MPAANPFDQFDEEPAQTADINPFDQFDAESISVADPQRIQAISSGVNRGIAGLAGLPVDTALNGWDLAKAGIGTVQGAITGRAPSPVFDPSDRSQYFGSSEYIENQFLNPVGLETQMRVPEDRVNRFLHAGGAAVPAVFTGAARTAPEVAKLMIPAATGAVAQQVAHESGASPATQAMAAMIGGVGGAAGQSTLRRAPGTAKAFVDPFRQGGREVIAGRVLNEAANTPELARARLNRPGEIVSESTPTTGAASRDAGLASFEDRLKNLEPGRFTGRASQQNEARNALLDSIAGGGRPKAIEALETRREQVTTPLREQAFKQAAGKSVNARRVLDDIDDLLAAPDNQGESVQKALQSVRKQIAGKPTVETTDGITVETSNSMTDARALYAVRKEINRILEGKYVGADESVLRYAGKQLGSVKDSIDSAIGEIAPTWKQYLVKYRQLSRPIDRAVEVQSIRERTSMGAPDLETGRDFISQAKWNNAVKRAMPDLERVMTKGQLTKLRQITTDLDRGAAAQAAAKRITAGSQTAANLVAQENMSVANIIGRTFGTNIKDLPPWLGTVTRPLSFVSKMADHEVRALLVDAMMDPKLAAKLMAKGTPENIRSFAEAVQQNAARGTRAGVSEMMIGVDEE